MILVVGATGFLGGQICHQLRHEGHSVRGLVRASSDPARVAGIKNIGVQLVEGDLKEAASLSAACQGIDTVVSTASATRSRQSGDSIEATDGRGQLNLVKAAKRAGVSKYIYVSFSAHIGEDDPLTRAKRSVESEVTGSGLNYTILRPTFFMESWLEPALGFDYRHRSVHIYGSGQNKVSWLSLGNVADFTVACLENRAADNRALDIGGPEALSPLEVVGIFEAVSGKHFRVEHVNEEILRNQQDTAADSLQETFAALMLAYAKGDVIDMTQTLREFPIRMTSVKEYAEACLSEVGAAH